MPDLVEDALLAVLPVERPVGTVAVHGLGGVPVAEHVVAHHREEGERPVAVELVDLGPGSRGWDGRAHWNIRSFQFDA